MHYASNCALPYDLLPMNEWRATRTLKCLIDFSVRPSPKKKKNRDVTLHLVQYNINYSNG